MTGIARETEKSLREKVPLPREELAEIHHEAVRRWRNDRRLRWVLVPLTLAGPAAFLFGRAISPTGLGLTAWRVVSLVLAVVVLAGGMIALMGLLRPRYDHHLRRVVRDRGYEMCLRCGYWLEELSDDMEQCPECGVKRVAVSKRSPEMHP